MNYVLLGVFALCFPFVELAFIWLLAWTIYLNFGVKTALRLILICIAEIVAIAMSFAVMYTAGYWGALMCIVSCTILIVAALLLTCTQWSVSVKESEAEQVQLNSSDRVFIKSQVDMIVIQSWKVVKSYIDNGVSLVRSMIDILSAGGYGSAVVAVLLCVVIFFATIAFIFYFSSLGFLSLSSLTEDANSNTTLLGKLIELVNIDIPILDTNVDVGLVLLDRLWTWGLTIITEVMYGSFQIARFGWSVFVPILNIGTIFWREVFINTATTVYECGTQSFKGEAAHGGDPNVFNGDVGMYIQRSGGYIVDGFTNTYDALRLSPPVVRGVQSEVPVPGWLHPDWKVDTTPANDLFQQYLIVGRDFSLCACNSTSSRELTKLIFAITYEPARSTFANFTQHTWDTFFTFVRMPFRLFSYGTFFVEPMLDIVFSTFYAVENLACFIDQIVNHAFTGVFQVINSILTMIDLAPIIAFNEPLPRRGVFGSLTTVLALPGMGTEFTGGLVLCVWELIQITITAVWHGAGELIHCSDNNDCTLPPGALYRTPEHIDHVHTAIQERLSMTHAAEYGIRGLEETAYFCYYISEKFRFALTSRGSLSPLPRETMTIPQCSSNVQQPMTFIYHQACAGVQLGWGALNWPRGLIRMLVGLISITANLDGKIDTFGDWTNEIGAFVESATANPYPTDLPISIRHEHTVLSHDGTDVFMANSLWAYSEKDSQFTSKTTSRYISVNQENIVSLTAESNRAWLFDETSVYACSLNHDCGATRDRLAICDGIIVLTNNHESCEATVRYYSGQLVTSTGLHKIIPRGDQLTLWFSADTWKAESIDGYHISLTENGCRLESRNGLRCATDSQGTAFYFERSGWSMDQITLKGTDEEFVFSGSSITSRPLSTQQCKLRNTTTECTYITVTTVETPDSIHNRCIIDETLLPLWYAFEHEKRVLTEFVQQDTALMSDAARNFLDLILALPKFAFSVPQVSINIARSSSRAIALFLSRIIGKQPWYRRNEQGDIERIPWSIPIDCEWGVYNRDHRSENYIAHEGSCFYDIAPVQKYPIAEALSLGHTPWYFEHMRHEWSRGLIFQDVYGTVEKTLASYASAWFGLYTFDIDVLIKKPFVHMQFVDEYSGFNDTEATSSMCPVYYCPEHKNYVECSLFLLSKTAGDGIQWFMRSLDFTNKRSTFDLVPLICSTTRYYTAWGSLLSATFIELDVLSVFHYNQALLTKAFAAFGRTFNTPLIYAQMMVNWLGTIIHPSQSSTKLTFDFIKNGAFGATYEVVHEQNELIWDILDGFTHDGPLGEINLPLKEMSGAVRVVLNSIIEGIADTLSYTIRVIGGIFIGVSNTDAANNFIHETGWYGHKLLTDGAWSTDPLVAWMEYQIDRIGYTVAENTNLLRKALIIFNTAIFKESKLLGPLGVWIEKNILSCENALVHFFADMILDVDTLADEIDGFIEDVLNLIVAKPINEVTDWIHTDAITGVSSAMEEILAQIETAEKKVNDGITRVAKDIPNFNIRRRLLGIFDDLEDGLDNIGSTLQHGAETEVNAWKVVFDDSPENRIALTKSSNEFQSGMKNIFGLTLADIEKLIRDISREMDVFYKKVPRIVTSIQRTEDQINADTTKVLTLIDSIFDKTSFRDGIVEELQRALESIIVTPTEDPFGINLYSIEKAHVSVGQYTIEEAVVGGKREGDIYFENVSFFSALLDRAILPNVYGEPIPGFGTPDDFTKGIGVRPDALLEFIEGGAIVTGLDSRTVTYSDPTVKEERSLFRAIENGARAYKNFTATLCGPARTFRRRLLDQFDYWTEVENLAQLYMTNGLLDRNLKCDAQIIWALRMQIPTPWSFDIVNCLDQKVTSDLYAIDHNTTAPSSIHYDSASWWNHVWKITNHIVTHPELPHILSQGARTYLSPTALAGYGRRNYHTLRRESHNAHMKPITVETRHLVSLLRAAPLR